MSISFCTASAMKLFSVRIKQIYTPAIESRAEARAILREERAAFVQTFSHSYSHNNEVMQNLSDMTTLLKFLNEAFDEEEDALIRASKYAMDDVNKPHRFYSAWMSDGKEERLGGYLSVDVLNGGRESYLRQLAVMPQYQKQGAARALVQRSMHDLPNLQRVTVSYRKTNNAAEAFYRKLGFVDADGCHSTLNPDVYGGLVWNK